MNIQQQTTSEVTNTDTVMGYNEDIDPPPSHDISNVSLIQLSCPRFVNIHPALHLTQSMS